ncbi:MAG: hypothetical protein ABIG96_04630 [Candidatus Micrarchaeota archaeon]
MKRLSIIALFLLLMAVVPLMQAADEVDLTGLGSNYLEPTIVVINSNKWQDAFLVTMYANLNKMPIRFIQDPYQTKDFLGELASNRVTKIFLFSRKDSTVLSINYLLKTQNLDVRETQYVDHQELSVKMLELVPSDTIILVRDDFAFDALTAKFLALQLNAPIIFTKGPEDMDPKVLDALRALRPKEIILVGRPSEKLEALLANFNVRKFQGRDEFDTNNIVSVYALDGMELQQAMVSTGDIFDLALMNVRNQPIFLVPESGTYSLQKTAKSIADTKMTAILGIGQLVTESGSWLRDTAKVKFIVKYGSIRPRAEDEGFVRKDLAINLEGYQLPIPKYDGKITEIDPHYADPFGSATGAMISRDRPAPPVEFRVNFDATGNIDFPAYVILEVRDETDTVVKTLQSERQMVYPKRNNLFTLNWPDAPKEGKYTVNAKVFADVYDVIELPGKKGEFELAWLYVAIALLLLIVAVLMLALLVFSSHVLSRDIFLFGGAYKKAAEQVDSIIRSINDLYHFRGRKRK